MGSLDLEDVATSRLQICDRGGVFVQRHAVVRSHAVSVLLHHVGLYILYAESISPCVSYVHDTLLRNT
jgi:hypothetical protein